MWLVRLNLGSKADEILADLKKDGFEKDEEALEVGWSSMVSGRGVHLYVTLTPS
jgi:hypothetical protein